MRYTTPLAWVLVFVMIGVWFYRDRTYIMATCREAHGDRARIYFDILYMGHICTRARR